ncbi:MAG TPA: cell division protein FtsZ [Bacteroidales bacterium]|nr:cell division protein FtsZ [Bacteroidales bacterium]
MTEKKFFEPDFGTKTTSSIIKVIGIGGGGGNAVKHMYKDGIQGVEFLICNTDRLALERNPIPEKLVLGESGLGAGANPDLARKLAEESREEIVKFIGPDTKMLFLTAGMGKGTGTGATPIVAQIAREMGILTVAVVTEPFNFEGQVAAKHAEDGIKELKKNVDSLIIVKNQNILKYYNDLDFDTAFGHADDVLKNAVKCIAELITINLDQNIDFNDIKSIMENSGPAMLGLAEAEGEDRVKKVVEGALNCPLLSEEHITNAKNFLFSLSYGPDNKFTINEFEELTRLLSELRSHNARVIWGRTEDKTLQNKIKLAVIVTNYAVDEVKTITNISSGTVTEIGDEEKNNVPLDINTPIDNPLFDQENVPFQSDNPVFEIINRPEMNSPEKRSANNDPFGFLNETPSVSQPAPPIPSSNCQPFQQTSHYSQEPQTKIIQEQPQQQVTGNKTNPGNTKPVSSYSYSGPVKVPSNDYGSPQRIQAHIDPRFENDSEFNAIYNTPALHRTREDNISNIIDKGNIDSNPFNFEDDMPQFFKSIPD